MRSSGDLQADADSGCEAVNHSVQSDADGPVRLLRVQPLEPVAHIDGPSVLAYLTQAEEEVGMGIVGLVHHLDDRVPNYLQRFAQRCAGEREDICSSSSFRLSR